MCAVFRKSVPCADALTAPPLPPLLTTICMVPLNVKVVPAGRPKKLTRLGSLVSEPVRIVTVKPLELRAPATAEADNQVVGFGEIAGITPKMLTDPPLAKE